MLRLHGGVADDECLRVGEIADCDYPVSDVNSCHADFVQTALPEEKSEP